MKYNIFDIMLIIDVIGTAVFAQYFGLASIANLKAEHRKKRFFLSLGFAKKEWFNELGWKYRKKMHLSIFMGVFFFLSIIYLIRLTYV